MVAASPQEQKRAVCTRLTGVLRASPLASAIDPKAFFMMLNANYALLCANGVLDLNLLWDALQTQHTADQLFGLFLRFEEAGHQLGLEVTLPPAVTQLSPLERSAYLGQSGPRPSLAPRPNTPADVLAQDLDDFISSAEGVAPQPVTHRRGSFGGLPSPLPGGGSFSPLGPITPSGGVPSAPPPPARSFAPPPPGRSLAPTPRHGSFAPGPQDGSEPVPLPASALTPLPDLEGTPIRLPDSALTPLPDIGADSEFEPTPLPDSAFAGLTSDQKKRIVTNLLSAVKQTGSGKTIRSAQLTYFLASRFDQLCDGNSFFFNQVRQALLESEGVSEEDVFVAAVRFRRWLATIGVTLVEPDWKLDPEVRDHLANHSSIRQAEVYTPSRPLPAVEDKPRDSLAPAAERTERELERYGLGLLKKDVAKWLRYAAYAMVLVLGGLAVWALHPVQTGDAGDYSDVFPLASLTWVSGEFIGTLDEAAWLKLPRTKRVEAVTALERRLKAEHKLRGARIIHPKTRAVVIFDVQGEALQAPPSILEAGIPKPAAH